MNFSSYNKNSADQGETVLLRGTVARITYHSRESGFGVLKAKALDSESFGAANNEGLITVVGNIPEQVAVGVPFVARGTWHHHPKFGKQFRAASLTEQLPTSRAGVARYLGSGRIKGIGEKLAERIVEAFGDQALTILEQDPQRLKDVPGIGKKKLAEILDNWESTRRSREIMLFFEEYEIPPGLAQRIFKTYGDKTIELVKQNPYRLARDIRGVGFFTADKIALRLGLDPQSEERVAAAELHTLREAGEDGHCYLPRETLLAKTGSLLNIGDGELLESVLRRSILAGELIEDDNCVYHPSLHSAETQVAELLKRRALGFSSANEISRGIAQEIAERSVLAEDLNKGSEPRVITFSEEQRKAIDYASQQSLVVITGGPGCGKTTTVRAVAEMFQRAGLDVRLAAPTGKAAQRLGEVTGIKASTIHRLLRYDPITRTFLHNEHLPLPLDALIVDECSMIDIQLAQSLLRAVPKSARLILVGDADQIPSVGPGLFFEDLLKAEQIPCARLTTLFRRDLESSVTTVAHSINQGLVPEIPEPDGKTTSDAYFLPLKDSQEIASLVERLVVDQIPKRFGISGSDILVLSPMNVGDLGITALNNMLQNRFVPDAPGLAKVKIGNLELRLGDRVVQRSNNYNITEGGVFNGDQGTIVGLDPGERKLQVRFWDEREVIYSGDDLYQLDLAYALTIHRSQGSEAKAVVVIVHESHAILLERQLIYTAVTRAKKLLIVVGTRRALALAVRKDRSRRRYSRLAERLCAS